MTLELASMRRTLQAAIVAMLAGAVGAILIAVIGSGLLAMALASCAAFGALAAALVAVASSVMVSRQRDVEEGEQDLFLRLNRDRSEQTIRAGNCPRPHPLRRWIARALFGHHLLVGDTVRVRSLQEIQRSLGTDGTLDGLPFMDEMAAFCGKSARVYRVLDKIYDYGRSRRMRRLDDAVLLVGLRCDGAAHGNCQAACYLIWKCAWLEPIDTSDVNATTMVDHTPMLPMLTRSTGIQPVASPESQPLIYRCQYTTLTSATRTMGALDLSRAVGAVAIGNVSLSAFIVAVLTRFANAVQVLRGGATYPACPRFEKVALESVASLAPGQWVRVNQPAQIAATLDRNSKNRGLWFDRDMLKHSGQTYRVLGRVERIVDINSGHMIPMKTPCIVLDGVDYSGEFQWFGEQHDYTYWREAWLTPADAPGSAVHP
jgi:hypothetical protein